jgi:hypothetical protein
VAAGQDRRIENTQRALYVRSSEFSLENEVFKPNFFYSWAKRGNISAISLRPLPNRIGIM